MKTSQLEHFVVAADELHFVRASQRLGISRQKLMSSIAAVEREYGGRPLFDPQASETRLTRAGEQAVVQAKLELAKPSTPPPAPPRPPGGKAKASKGQGRAPVVKGEPKPFKKRQGR
ncbi:MAG: LysR family transcriptional regulator [Frondihabitans sp.]|nr:LysR family transcriptional regulator [Frondihabitans sp.]